MLPIIGFIFNSIALILISITLIARANEQRYKHGLRWQIRLLGFVLGFAAPWPLIVEQFCLQDWPTMWSVITHVGIACVFLTTPIGMPWHIWIWKGSKGDTL